MNKILFVLASVLVIYVKPIMGFCIFLPFLPEYFIMFMFLINALKNCDKYYVLGVKELDVSRLNIFELWLEICRLRSFRRVYTMLSRKKISLVNIVLFIIVWFFSIPLKFLRLFYDLLIRNRGGVKDRLIHHYFRLHISLRGRKIEILNRKVFLNCYSVGKLIRRLQLNQHCGESAAIDLMERVRKAAIDFEKYERDRNELEILEKSVIYNKDGGTLLPHYAHFSGNSSIHATKNTNFELSHNQKLDLPMPSMAPKWGKRPGTVVTYEIDKFEKIGGIREVPKYELDGIKYNHPELFRLNSTSAEYMHDKSMAYREILWGARIRNEGVIAELRTNQYTMEFISLDEETMAREVIRHFHGV